MFATSEICTSQAYGSTVAALKDPWNKQNAVRDIDKASLTARLRFGSAWAEMALEAPAAAAPKSVRRCTSCRSGFVRQSRRPWRSAWL